MKTILTYILLFASIVYGQSVYYVQDSVANTNASDLNIGTDINNPWASWQKAFNSATAGDTVYFRGGTWYKRNGDDSPKINLSQGFGNSGTYENYIHYFAYPPDVAAGDSVWYDCQYYVPPGDTSDYTAYNGGLDLSNANYIHIKGLNFKNIYQTRLFVEVTGINVYNCSYITLENIKLSIVSGHAIFVSPNSSGIDSTYLINIDTYASIDSFAINNYQYNRGASGTWGVGIFAVNYPNQYMEIRGCRSWHSADDGYNFVPTGTIRVFDTWSFLNGVYGDGPGSTGGGTGFKMNTSDTEDIFDSIPGTIYHVDVRTIAAFNKGYGYSENNNGLRAINRFVFNNIAYKNNGSGFNLLGNDPVEYEHLNNDYRNNIAYGNLGGDFNEYQGAYAETDTFNTWTDGQGIVFTDSDLLVSDSATIVSYLLAERQADGSLPLIHPFRLDPSSSMIDGGTPTVIDSLSSINADFSYYGDAPDIGAFEYVPPVASSIIRHLGSGGKIYYINGKYLK